ncbi:helix-turn-helix domain-containing protein [Bradyrhizobium sp.]|uniref:helix-turn-helix domain-containing protein n=1 Tax=Bradyrhizobium sp. TaxID=376 RepID=UPI00403803AD
MTGHVEISSTSTPAAAVLPRAVRRALDVMHAGLDRDIGVAELAEAAGLSARALQRQFKTFLGKSPHEALRDIRFESARRQLLLGKPGTRVMEVASRYGFTHFGRFSIEYRRRYDETPTQTLRRQATFHDTVCAQLQSCSAGAERPTLSVGPIDTVPGHDEAARGIADEVATALARAGIAATLQTGSARYHLAGTIKGDGPQARLIFRLIDRESGRHLWAHRIEGDWDRATAFDEQLAARLAAALHPSLRAAEIDRALQKQDRDLTAQDLALRAMPGVLSLDEHGNARAIELLNEAMTRDPDYPLPFALAAWAHAQRVVYYFGADPVRDRAQSAECARKALSLRADPTALAIVGNALSLLNDDSAEQVIARALAIDGGSAWAWGRSGWIDTYKGNDDTAIERFMIALELAPTDALAFNNLYGIGVAHFNAGRFRDAAVWQERALAEHPQLAWMHRTLCPAYMFAGGRDEASDSARRLQEGYPELTLAKVTAGLPPLPQATLDRLVGALHDVGLPA